MSLRWTLPHGIRLFAIIVFLNGTLLETLCAQSANPPYASGTPQPPGPRPDPWNVNPADESPGGRGFKSPDSAPPGPDAGQRAPSDFDASTPVFGTPGAADMYAAPPPSNRTPHQDEWEENSIFNRAMDEPMEEEPLPEEESTVPEDPLLNLRHPVSQWDLAQIEGPLFGTEQLTEFTQQPLTLEGKWSLRPHVSLAAVYDGNVFISEKDRQSDFILRIAPGISLRIGDGSGVLYLTADYTVGVILFADNGDQDSLDHSAKVDVQWTLSKLRVGLHLGIQFDTGTSIDVTDRVRRRIYYAGITSSYKLSDKTSIDLNADHRYSDYGNLISAHETRVQSFFNYQVRPKLTLGIGATLGVLNVGDSPEQTYEEASLRAIYAATGKLTVSANVGVEFRQFGGGGGNTVSPVFSLDAAWAVREGTTISLSLRRRIFSSAIFANQDFVDTGATISISQRFTRRCTLFLTLGYENLDYVATADGVTADRQDNFFFVRPGIQFQLAERWTLGLFYEFSQNVSSGSGERDFVRDRLGLQMGFVF